MAFGALRVLLGNGTRCLAHSLGRITARGDYHLHRDAVPLLWGSLRLEPEEPWPSAAPPQVTQQGAGARP